LSLGRGDHSVPLVVNVSTVLLVAGGPLGPHKKGVLTAVTTTPLTGCRVESDKTLKKMPPGWPEMLHVVEVVTSNVVSSVVVTSVVAVTVTVLEDEYW
jgi:hypothetical protein